MLGLAGANTDEDSPRVRSDPASQRTLVKQLHRVDMTNADWHDGLQTPPHVFTKKPTALESLSRTAPVGSSTPMQRRKFAVYDGPSTVPTKRPSSDMDRYHAIDESIVAPACAKRRCARRNSHKLSVVEHVQEMVAPMEDRLPNAVDTVANVYDARNTRGVGDPELTILGRSLLYAAMAVECADEENNGAASFASHRPVEEQVGDVEAEPQRADDISDNREALSPTAAGLFCEEEYAEATDEDDDAAKRVSNGCSTASSTTSADHESISSGGQIGGKHSRSAMQERAVLQEFSVWLRNVAADARSCE
ncbi:unnamed protein product [Hyaloperonospora brassicae]|uniref:RxLR effector candidate protein n=1 Tax=Hyaloperonospora brassicae TaxID=162125 RepID=A0AAV0U2Q8_HYABA|nr:unnamed protein product [Hyaloperonospora brassicae]